MMLYLITKWFWLNLLLFPLLISFFSHGAAFIHDPYSPVSEIDESEFGRTDKWNTKRILGEIPNGTDLILAANRTRRKDPLNHFEYYTGGWNITDQHYLFSLGFSAVPPLITAIVWFVGFGIFLLTLCICACCCRKSNKNVPYSPKAYTISLVFLCIFTLSAVIGVTILLIGQDRYHNSIVGIMDYILHEANIVIFNIQDLLRSLMSAKSVGVGPAALPSSLQNNVDGIGVQINMVTEKITNVTTNNADEIKLVMYPIKIALFTVAITCLILALLGSLSAVLGYDCLVFTIVILGWILVVFTLIMSGIFLLIHNATADTCQAMTEWLHDPLANSALEDLLPRVDNATAQNLFMLTKSMTVGIIYVMNNVTTNITNANFTPEAKYLYYNQSGPLVPLLCNPYNDDYTDRKCATGEVEFANASKVWKEYVCEISDSGICKTQGRLTPDNYTQLTASVNVTYGLYKYTPFIVELMDSTFIKQTFTKIIERNCPELSKYSDWTYAGFMTSSLALIKSMLIWIVYASQRRQRDDKMKSMKKESNSNSRNEKGSVPRYDEDPLDNPNGSLTRNKGDPFGSEKQDQTV